MDLLDQGVSWRMRRLTGPCSRDTHRMGSRSANCRRAVWIGSLLLTIALSAWLVSLAWHIGWWNRRTTWSVGVAQGQLVVCWIPAEHQGTVLGLSPGWFVEPCDYRSPLPWGLWWPVWANGVQSGFTIPLWIPVAGLAVVTGISLWQARRQARRGAAFPTCLRCGYNLTGNVSGRCPECGEIVPGAR
jgi:hypothetical protein